MRQGNARNISYEMVRFQGSTALFTSLRVDRASVPEEIHQYEIREEGGDPCQLARRIAVDHYGTLLTSDPIQLPADEYLSFTPNELVYMEVKVARLEYFQQLYPPTTGK